MHIYIAADHRAHTYKLDLVQQLTKKGYAVTDVWNSVYDPQDDHPDAAQAVVEALRRDPHGLGVVMCGSGVGVSIAANRYKGIYCVLGHDLEQVKHARAWDHTNVLAIGSEYTTLADAVSYVEAMIDTKPDSEQRMLRRVKKTDMLGS